MASNKNWETNKNLHATNMNAGYCGYKYYYEATEEKVEQKTNFMKGYITHAFITHQVLAQTST
ncbi:hypothetical protein [Priestia taiwanensis]|uniref:Uncharacterized protein n=1 Tax=Priestia taiwanensis TaxID=1347902 RepID=A0A917ER80_9BACI|nr:hypothetical protein [Priestia taiwanensis]MBM7363566.1 hypothetical protein [Priestia taiwanensis]GGE76036.1 hypothetical protein GCM10007140_27240 [Priestia taiwanensis]